MITSNIDPKTLKECMDSILMDTGPTHYDGHEKFIDFLHGNDVLGDEIKGYGMWQFANGFNTAIISLQVALNKHGISI